MRVKVIPREGKKKLAIKWLGPYTIAEISEDENWYTFVEESLQVNYDRLLPYRHRPMHYRVNEQEDVIIDTDGHKDALTNNESIPCDEVPPVSQKCHQKIPILKLGTNQLELGIERNLH